MRCTEFAWPFSICGTLSFPINAETLLCGCDVSNSYGGGADLWANAIEAPCYRDCLERRKQHNSCFENEENRANISSNLLNVDGSIAMSKSDGHLEVLGVRMVHLATSQVKTGLASGLKLAQARKITIHIRGSQPIAMQVDGEPRLQEPATIELRSAPEGAAVVLQVCPVLLLLRNPLYNSRFVAALT